MEALGDWDSRNLGLASRLADLIRLYARPSRPLDALDVGTQRGRLVAEVSKQVNAIQFQGIEPCLEAEEATVDGVHVRRASCAAIPFGNDSFDVVTLASVYEHINPGERLQSLREIRRVLRPGGILVGQIPNMNFPIEVHSRLPFQQFLPRRVAEVYLRRFSPVPWRVEGTNWFRVGPGELARRAREVGLDELAFEAFNPPLHALPPRWRPFSGILNVLPLGFTFVFSRAATA